MSDQGWQGPPPDWQGPAEPVAQGIAPPHSIEAEQGVLGAVLLSEASMYAYVVEAQLKPDDFYRERHRIIFAAMTEMHAESVSIDHLTLREYLRDTGRLEAAGGQAGVDELTSLVPAVGNLRLYGKTVRERAVLRRLLQVTWEVQATIQEGVVDVGKILGAAEAMFLEASQDDLKRTLSPAGRLIEREMDVWHRLSQEGATLTGVPSGFHDLDRITGGFQPGNLIVVAARPSMGKSALITNIAEHVTLNERNPKPVALFSLEMSDGEVCQRLVSSLASVDSDDIRRGRLDDERKWKRVLDAAARYDEAPLYVDDSSEITVAEVRAKVKRFHQQMMERYGGLGLIVVDYLQLMRPDDGSGKNSRAEQVGAMSRSLKILARELEVPVVALSQLSRGVESRTDKRPMLSDLRDSGAIEQDADLVMFIYRDEHYKPETTEKPGEAELIIAKHRAGALGVVELVFQGKYTRFRSKERLS